MMQIQKDFLQYMHMKIYNLIYFLPTAHLPNGINNSINYFYLPIYYIKEILYYGSLCNLRWQV